MTTRPVGHGQRVQSAMRADTWNAFVRAANANDLRGGETIQDIKSPQEVPFTTCKVMATTALERREATGLVNPSITPTDGAQSFRTRRLFAQDTPVSGAFGLSTQLSGVNAYTPIVTGGIVDCKLFVPTNGDWIPWADVDPADATRLRSTPSGSAQILWKDAGTNAVVDAIVRLGNPGYREYPAKVALGAIQPGSFGNAYFWQSVGGVMTDTQYLIGEGQNENARVYLDWMHGDQAISDGKEVLIGYFPSEGIWRVVAAECEDQIEPAIGQMQDSNGGTQLLTTTPAPWNSFDSVNNLSTSNMSLNAAGATTVRDLEAGEQTRIPREELVGQLRRLG